MQQPLVKYGHVLDEDINKFYEAHRQTDEQLAKKKQLRDDLEFLLNRHLDDEIKLFMVGSSATGVGRYDCDVDFCMVFPQLSMLPAKSLDILRAVEVILKATNGNDIGEIRFTGIVIIEAKVPIIKFTDRIRKIDVNLNVNKLVAIRNTHLIRHYVKIDKRVAPIILIVKCWAKDAGINNAYKHTLSSYSLTLMVIHYFQYGCYEPVLPCLHNLRSDVFWHRSNVAALENVEVYFEQNNTMGLGELFAGFLYYYANQFNFLTNIISIRLGRKLRKRYIPETGTRIGYNMKFVCIEEPFERINTAYTVFDQVAFNRIYNCLKRSCDSIYCTQRLKSVMGGFIAN